MALDLIRATRIRKQLMPCVPMTKEHKIPFTVENMSQMTLSNSLTDHRRSEIQPIRESEWLILLGKEKRNQSPVTTLSFWVACRMQPGNRWFCDADLEFRLVSQNSSAKSPSKSGCNDITWRTRHLFRGDTSGAFQLAGLDEFDDFDLICTPGNGFIADDSIYVEVVVRDVQCFTVSFVINFIVIMRWPCRCCLSHTGIKYLFSACIFIVCVVYL
jgi:hypothetical protein